MKPSTRPSRGRRYRYSAMALVALMAVGGADQAVSRPAAFAPAVHGDDHPLSMAASPLLLTKTDLVATGPAWAGIPATALAAYHRAADSVARCGLDWTVLAAIGKVESNHARNGDVTPNGALRHPVFGPVLDGTNGTAAILTPAGSGHSGQWARAEGPMQFLPSTWEKWAADGTGDGTRDVQNVFDAALAAAHYLCSGKANLSTGSGLRDAILRYNPSLAYLALVSYWIRVYGNGVAAVPDQPINGNPNEIVLADADVPNAHPAISPAPERNPGTTDRHQSPPPISVPPPPSPAPPAASPAPAPKQPLKPVTQLVNGVTEPLVHALLG